MATSQQRIILITGANAGIGRELASQLLADKTVHILAGVRSKEKGSALESELNTVKDKQGTFETILVDVSKDESIDAAVEQVASKYGRLDALINNAGIATAGEHLPLSEQMLLTFKTNTVGPAVMVEKFHDLLEKSTQTVRIVNVSSGAGSIGRRLSEKNSPFYKMKALQYRASKAALNMVTADQHAMNEDLGWKVFSYCPGFTVTDFSGSNTAENGAHSAEIAVKPLVEIINGKKDDESGSFLNNKNTTFPW